MTKTTRQLKLTAAYFTVSVVCAALGLKMPGTAGAFFIWAAVVYLYVSFIYFLHQGCWLMGKRSGKIDLLAYVVMAPFYVIAYVSQKYQMTLNPKESSLIGKDIVVRQLPENFDKPSIDMCAEFSAPVTTPYYYNISTLDLIGVRPSTLDKVVEAIKVLKKSNEVIYINCALGKGRSVAGAIAWLIASGQAMTIEDAFSMIKANRPCAVLPLETKDFLQEWLNARKR